MAVARSDDGSGNTTRRRPLRKPLGAGVATDVATPPTAAPGTPSAPASPRFISPAGMRLDDLYRLPMPKLFALAEPIPGPSTEALGRLARELRVVIIQVVNQFDDCPGAGLLDPSEIGDRVAHTRVF